MLRWSVFFSQPSRLKVVRPLGVHKHLLDWHPHVHAMFAWGYFDRDGAFHGMPRLPDESIRELFMHKVFKLMIKAGLIGEDVAQDIRSWPHSGFHVWVGPLVSCLDTESLERLSQYSARGPVSLERLSFVPGGGSPGGGPGGGESGGRMSFREGGDDSGEGGSGKYGGEGDGGDIGLGSGIGESPRGWNGETLDRVVCRSGKYLAKHKGSTRVLDPLSFIAELTTHIPDHHQKTAIYYGRYSNKSRGMRKKAEGSGIRSEGVGGAGENSIESGLGIGGIGGRPDENPGPAAKVQVIEEAADRGSSQSKASWARFLKKVYEADPLLCPSCGAQMRIISFIEDEDVIFRILNHLDLLGKDPPSVSERGPPSDTEGS